jgi:2-methylcitrate dehydratase PrpD
MGMTDEFAELAVGLRWQDMAPATREAAVRTTANILALAVGAAGHPAVDRATAAVTGLGTEPEARILGRPERTSAVWTAFVHGIAGHVEDFDDTHPATIVHPGSPIVPAALAASERVPCSGEELLCSVLAGAEVALRLATCLAPHAIGRGWHMTGVAGHVGAAVAAGRILGLDHAGHVAAMGLAATQGAGLTAALGTMAKPMHAGKAAAGGTEAALLAAAGFTGPKDALEGRLGLLAVMAGQVDTAPGLRDLGRTWEIEKNEIKPFSCGVLSHSIIDLARELRREVPPEQGLAQVRLTVHPLVIEAMGHAEPVDGLQSKFSAYHCFAVGYLDDAAGPPQYSYDHVAERHVASLRRAVELIPDPELGRYEVRAEIRTRDGSDLRRTRPAPLVLSGEGFLAKATQLATARLGESGPDFVRLVFRLETLESLEEVWRASGAPAAVGPRGRP